MKNLRIKQKDILTKLPRKFLVLTILVLVLKVFIIFSIEGKDVGSEQSIHFVKGIWLGADGENYLTAYKSLLSDGIFSKAYILNYWPAGYPLLIFLFSIISKTHLLTILAIVQSLIFSLAALFFIAQIFKSRISNYSYLIYAFIILNPTLTLSTITIGYESLVAAGIMFSSALIIKDFSDKNKSRFLLLFCSSSFTYGLISFMQPRFVLTGIIVHVLWIAFRNEIRLRLAILAISIVITLVFPSTLIIRNLVATQSFSVSTNLGETMAVGAGPGATGAYKKRLMDIPCNISGTAVERDRQITRCVMSWHLTNPKQASELMLKKAIYFWSPWTGSLSYGTMARNPWVGLSPAIKIAAGSTEGYTLVTGLIGKIISVMWLLSGLILVLYGAVYLFKLKSFERLFSIISLAIIGSQMLITMVTIGDHRFRLPIMPLSLMLQAVAIKSIFSLDKATLQSSKHRK
jgi:hypothetical protein